MSPGPWPCSCSLVVMGASQDPRGRVVVRLCLFRPCACARSDGYEKKTTSDERQPLLPVGNVLGPSSFVRITRGDPHCKVLSVVGRIDRPDLTMSPGGNRGDYFRQANAGSGWTRPAAAASSCCSKPCRSSSMGNRQQGLCRHRSVDQKLSAFRL